MLSSERKVSLIAALAALAVLLLTPGCKGFFVNQPTSITVSPNTVSPTAGVPQKFTAVAAYSGNNGSKDVTTSATWTSSNPCAVPVIATGSNAGNATAVGTGGAVTISASLDGVIGTATATVPTGLTITPCTATAVGSAEEVIFHVNSSQTFVANSSGSVVSATWTSSNSTIVNINSATGQATFPSAGQAMITATSNPETGTLLITVQ